MNILPDRLGKEPLIDAVFECRFVANMPMANVLPGFLMSNLQGINSVNNLPAAELPQAIRNTDPNLAFSPLIRIEWGEFNLSIGDRNIIIGCKLPYPGWMKFKAAILEVLKVLPQLNGIQSVQRYSMKYIDLIPLDSLASQAEAIDLKLSIGNIAHTNERFNIRLDIEDDNFIHILNIVSGASSDLGNGKHLSGLVIDTDTIKNVDDEPYDDWVGELGPHLDQLHISNKKMFFNCLSENGLTELSPQYE